jgi:dihydroorotate dehydrogenase (fumarate)
MNHLRRVKDAVAVPVIASLNGTTNETWLREAERIQRAGADALELNIYHIVTDPNAAGVAIEERLRHAVIEVKRLLHIPVAVKLTPFFTAFGNLAHQLDEAGADGLVLFNRFYQPDIDIRTMTATPEVVLSRSSELLLRLRWLAILHGRIKGSLAATGGIETSDDAIKALLAGADAVQMVSAILRHGPAYFRKMRDGLERWMEWHHFDNITGFRGRLGLHDTADPEAHERGDYIRVLHSWKV